MLAYILRRILLFIPTLLAISLAAFLISVNAPGDPVERLLNTGEGGEMNQSIRSIEKVKREKRHELGLDLPLFYFTLGTLEDIRNPALQKEAKAGWQHYIPAMRWNGFANQYHRWISRIILHGDFGISYRDQQPVMGRIKEKFGWSFTLTLLSVLLAYLISIPVGVYAAYKRDKPFDRIAGVLLFVLYSLPSFFVGTLLLVLFANPDFLHWFPEGGVQNPTLFDPAWPFLKKASHWAPYLILPLITYTYSSIAFISRQARAGVVEALQQDYVRTARAKGVPEKQVVWRHALRNALLPLITIFAYVLPAAIAGSVIVETIFSIPGMGLEIYESILNYDYPMIVAVFSIFGFLTLLGYLAADILYAVADPRISYTRK